MTGDTGCDVIGDEGFERFPVDRCPGVDGFEDNEPAVEGLSAGSDFECLNGPAGVDWQDRLPSEDAGVRGLPASSLMQP